MTIIKASYKENSYGQYDFSAAHEEEIPRIIAMQSEIFSGEKKYRVIILIRLWQKIPFAGHAV